MSNTNGNNNGDNNNNKINKNDLLLNKWLVGNSYCCYLSTKTDLSIMVVMMMIMMMCISKINCADTMDTLSNQGICYYVTSNGYKYDKLINLRLNESNPNDYYNGINENKQYKMIVNVCGNAPVGCNPVAASCLEDAFANYYSCGLLSSMVITEYVNETSGKLEADKGVVITYQYEDGQCYSNPSVKTLITTKIIVTCDKDAKVVSNLVFSEPTSCNFIVRMSSIWGCPSTSSGPIPGINSLTKAIIITGFIILALVLYFFIHMMVNIICLKKTGISIIPWNRVLFCCCCCSNDRTGYQKQTDNNYYDDNNNNNQTRLIKRVNH